MPTKRVFSKSRRTPDQVARDKAIRARFQAWKPSLDDLATSGKYSGPVKQGEFRDLLRFAGKFKKFRERANLSLTDVSRLTGIDKAAISRFENGLSNNPTLATLEKLARAVGKKLVLELA